MMSVAKKNQSKNRNPKVAALATMKRRSVTNAVTLKNTHHSENTKRGGNTQAPAIPPTLTMDTLIIESCRKHTESTPRRSQ